MPERPIPQTEATIAPKPRRRLRLSDVGILVVLAIVVLLLANTLKDQLDLRHEAASARTATNGFLTDINKQDAASAYKFGNDAFKAKYTQKELANLFTSLAPLVKNHPKVIKQTVTNGTVAQVVTEFYQFSDPTYFFGITVRRPNNSDKWELINFSGSPTQANLFKVQ